MKSILVGSHRFKLICANEVNPARAGAHVEDQTKEGFEKLTHLKFELYTDKAGETQGPQRQNIGRSEGYKARASALNGIASVGKNAPEADVVVEEE